MSVVPIPAATVVCVRPGPPLEVVVVRRNSRLGYHGGAWVFPGGRIDPADHLEGDGLEAAAAAAVREAEEEAGLLLERTALVHHAHWTTPRERPKRFATDFFLTRADGELTSDGGEIVEARWRRPDEMLDAHAQKRVELPPPTFVTLWRLRDQGMALFEATPRRILPHPVAVPGGFVSLYPSDAGYEAMDPDAPGPRHRSYLLDSGWRFEES